MTTEATIPTTTATVWQATGRANRRLAVLGIVFWTVMTVLAVIGLLTGSDRAWFWALDLAVGPTFVVASLLHQRSWVRMDADGVTWWSGWRRHLEWTDVDIVHVGGRTPEPVLLRTPDGGRHVTSVDAATTSEHPVHRAIVEALRAAERLHDVTIDTDPRHRHKGHRA